LFWVNEATGACRAPIEARQEAEARTTRHSAHMLGKPRLGSLRGRLQRERASARAANRAELAAQRDLATKTLPDLKIEKAKIDGDKKMADADLNPV
jgi:hypothetical protein